jgi:hypothetical protein
MKIKMRIAVAANAEGEWNAYGFHNHDGWHDVMDGIESLDNEHRFWVEAEIDVPDDVPVVAASSVTSTDGTK